MNATTKTEVQNTEQATLKIEGLIDAKSIVSYLGISPSMFSKLRTAGVIRPPVKIGASARWDVNYIREIAETGLSLPKQKKAA